MSNNHDKEIEEYVEQLANSIWEELGIPKEFHNVNEETEEHINKSIERFLERAKNYKSVIPENAKMLDDNRWTTLDKIPPCEYCEHCTDCLYDNTVGTYLWLCNHCDDNPCEYCFGTGMRDKCPLGNERLTHYVEKETKANCGD